MTHHQPSIPRDGKPGRNRLGWGKKILIALGILLALVLIVGIVLYVTKPWSPPPEVADPAASGQRITDDGMLGNWYPAPEGQPGPAALVVGGSEGGLHPGVDRTAELLQREGYSALALSYWGAPGQPQAMDALRVVETFDAALAWLARQPQVDPERLGMIGTSKGGEATVLMASRSPQVRAAVGYVPSNVVWQGIDLREPWRMTSIGSTWSEGGRPLPYLPYSSEFQVAPPWSCTNSR